MTEITDKAIKDFADVEPDGCVHCPFVNVCHYDCPWDTVKQLLKDRRRVAENGRQKI
jgi:radical SAM protein with 4Fe4S-binding SPASM domain